MTSKAKIQEKIIKPWAVFYLVNNRNVCIENFSKRGDAEVYAFNLRKMIKHKVEVAWCQE
jgi:hypothetical protein